MADPLSLLREYTINNKEIIERDDKIIFGADVFPKDVKTNSVVLGSDKKGNPKQYYTLESILYLLKNSDVIHPEYIKQAEEAGIVPVRRPNRNILKYLKGETDTHVSIEKKAPQAPPTKASRKLDGDADGEEPVKKKSRFDKADMSKAQKKLGKRKRKK